MSIGTTAIELRVLRKRSEEEKYGQNGKTNFLAIVFIFGEIFGIYNA